MLVSSKNTTLKNCLKVFIRHKILIVFKLQVIRINDIQDVFLNNNFCIFIKKIGQI